MKTGYIIAPIAILAMLVLAAFSTPMVMAQNACMEDIKTRNVTGFGFTNGTITNGTVIVLEGGSGNGPWTITLPPGEVIMAYAHWHAWGTSNPTVTFTNGDGYTDTIQIIDCEFDDNISGCFCSGYLPNNGTHHYYWKVNATPGVNTLNITSGDVYDKWFVAVINDTDAANRTHSGHWWHNFGLRKLAANNAYPTWFYNATLGPVTKKHNYTLWTAQSHYDSSDINISVNNHLVGTIHGPGGYPFSLAKFNVPGDYIETDGSQKVTWYMGPPDDSFYVYFATLAEAIPLPDLVVEDFKFPDTAEKGKDFGVNVTIRNQGAGETGGTFNVSLSVVKEGTTYKMYKIENVGPLGPSDKTIVNFTVNLSEDGCYNFTAVADCDGDVKESDEKKNASSAYFQVGGGVIVVHNNSDLMSVANRVVNGTYYIENRTITNCAGCGITIENTTLPVVIQNCTIHDCGYKVPLQEPAGICLRNVTNVTIGGYRNMIVNNTDAGIRVRNSTHVDIIDNYISNNTKYGIYVYPDNLVKPPYPEYVKYINITNNTVLENGKAVTPGDGGIILTQVFNCTVSCNTVQDNDDYGIYVCGNYSCIYNNTIVNNSVYGMYLFNASHNIIFWNDFIDNNETNNPEYPKHQAYDMWKGQPGLNPHNHWNSTISDFVYKHSGTGSGGSNVSYMGNYWDNTTCTDANNDGICDSPYKIDGATAANDYYPLKEQWQNYTLMCGDANCDGGVSYSDALKVFRRAQYHEAVCSDWAADANCDGGVSYSDALKVFRRAQYHEALNCCTGCE